VLASTCPCSVVVRVCARVVRAPATQQWRAKEGECVCKQNQAKTLEHEHRYVSCRTQGSCPPQFTHPHTHTNKQSSVSQTRACFSPSLGGPHKQTRDCTLPAQASTSSFPSRPARPARPAHSHAEHTARRSHTHMLRSLPITYLHFIQTTIKHHLPPNNVPSPVSLGCSLPSRLRRKGHQGLHALRRHRL